MPYPGSEFYSQLKREGKWEEPDWANFSSYASFSSKCPVYVPEGMTKEELMQIQKSAIRQFYLRPKMIFNQLFRLRQIKPQDYIAGIRMMFSK